MQFLNSSSNQPAVERNEILEFAKAWIGTALAFAILFSGGNVRDSRFLMTFVMAALTAGLGVILHELAHRVVARAYGATAHFIANDTMLILSIVIAFGGFLFAAPGAVWHRGFLTPRQSGLVAAAGPVTNMVIALICVGALFVMQNVGGSALLYNGLRMGFAVNALLGVFNMLPIGPIDGAKVMNWSRVAFGVLLAISAGIAFGLPRILPGLPRIF